MYELEEKERVANESVEGLMMDIATAEEEITRWKVAAEQEAAAGRAVEQEFIAKGDRVSCGLTVGAGCTTVFTTQSSTKVYKSVGLKCFEQLLEALALLADYIDKEDSTVRIGAIMGLGLAYAGSQNEQESVEATAEVSKTFNQKIRKYCDMTLMSCAYAGTGNVLKNLLGHCAQHLDKEETHQGPAVLGIAMVAMAEELGLEMAIRSLEHLLQYGEQNIRKAVPLALGLLCISNPKVNVMDTLSRLSHDSDSEVAMAAIISLGGAGTNNARIAGMLRNLSSYYYKEASLLFCVQIAQGLVHLGKGLRRSCTFRRSCI
ncbi:26S proteasome non-ATPase regulatory subunit 2 A [Ranunculus cassubicifolius]